MEGLAAVALAGNILQFVQCSTKIVSETRKIWMDDGDALKENKELTTVISHLRGLLSELERSRRTAADPTLDNLVCQCSDLTTEILAALDKLGFNKATGKRTRLLESLVLSTKARLKRSAIFELESRVNRMRDAVCMHMNVLLYKRLGDIMTAPEELGSGHPVIFPTQDDLLSRARTLKFNTNKILARLENVVRGDFSEEAANIDVAYLVREENLPLFCQQMKDFQKTRRIARSLHFQQIRERQSEIVEAHRNTFEWIFDKHTSTNFDDWLRSGNGIYWLTGKPGSGKSTLMKFLATHQKTFRSLGVWAKGQPRLIASHFFWSAGTPVQKSQEGLLRTILFDIIVGWPPLAQVLCPDRYTDDTLDDLEPWTRNELLKCITRLANAPNLPIRLCIFIDGLDEYRGDVAQLVQSLRMVAETSHAKMCVSSRPWNEFTDLFGDSPMQLHIHDLTKADIQTFVRDNLEESSRFQALQLSDQKSASDLISEITTRASGVFLWVYLVVRSLLRGFTNEDEISDLYARVRELPLELEEFFARMLDSIEPVYKTRAARILKLVAYANGPLPLLTFFFLDVQGEGRWPKDTISFDDWPMVDPGIVNLVRVKKRQLIAQCKDLLHISTTPREPLLLSEKVGPLHRTVIDFLRVDRVDRELSRLTADDFEPWTELFKATANQLLALVGKSKLVHLKPYLQEWFANVLEYESHIEIHSGRAELQAMDDLEQRLAAEFSRYPYSLQDGIVGILGGPKPCRCFLELAVESGLKIYATEKVKACRIAELAGVVECALGHKVCVGWQPTASPGPNRDVLDHILSVGVPSDIQTMINNAFDVTPESPAKISEEEEHGIQQTVITRSRARWIERLFRW